MCKVGVVYTTCYQFSHPPGCKMPEVDFYGKFDPLDDLDSISLLSGFEDLENDVLFTDINKEKEKKAMEKGTTKDKSDSN